MKKLIVLASAFAITVSTFSSKAHAGDREWATAGKILTGVFAGSVLTRAFDPAPVATYHHTTTVYTAPAMASTPVYVQQVPVVMQQQPQVIYQPAPVYVQPAPVYVQQPTVIYQPAPVVTYYHSYHRGFFCRPRPTFCW